ncbi:MAG: glycosyltransferase family 39 protein, partial [Tepidisphaeraceae bacterium]
MSWTFVAGMTAVAVVAMVVMLACTRWGVATSSDSARYVRTARHILGTEPVVESHESKHEQAHYPPVYPMALAAAGWMTRQDPLAAARVLHAAIFAANALLAALLVRRAGGAVWAAVLAAAIVVVSPVTITTHAWLLSEALFISLAFATILLVCMYLDRPRIVVLIAAAVATSLGMLTRYAGAALGPAVVLTILLNGRARRRTTRGAERSEALDSPRREMRSIAHIDPSIHQRARRRWIDAAVFSAVALALPVAWFARNLGIGGSATNRTFAFHPISL